MKQVPLIEKSAVARRLGGAKVIRAHALPERLLISAEIARELGRRKPERSCASKYFRFAKEKEAPPVLAGIAMRHGLRKELREALYMQAELDLTLQSRIASAERLYRKGRKEEARKEVLEVLKSQLADVDPRISRAIYVIYRLRYSEIKPLATQVFRKKMEEMDYDAAYQVASQWRLWEERKKAALCFVKKELYKGNFEKARKIAGERGVGKKGIRSIAKQVATDLIAKEEYSAAIALAGEFRIRAAAEEAVLAMFEYCMESGSYLEAAHLAKAYGMEKEMKEAATLLFDSLRDSNMAAAIFHANEFGFRELASELGKKLIEIQVLFGDYPRAISIAEGLGHPTKELAIAWFHNELKEGKSIKAISIAIKYGLKEEKEELGREMFLKRLGGMDYSGALKIAKTCGLEEELQIIEELKKFRAKASQPR